MAPYLFNGYKYIGTSKGACRLCNCYFEAHPSKIQARGSHGNLYPNWAFPPVLKRDGTPAQQRRQKIINYIIEKIRRDTLAVLKDKSTMGKRHDSNTYDMSQADDDEDDMQVQVDDSDTSEVEDEGPDEIAELTERLNGNLGFTSSSTEETFPTSDFEDEDGDEEGGDEEGDDEDGDDEDGDDDEGGAIL